MKKVIICLLMPLTFQQCTDELHEIDGVVASSGITSKELVLDAKDVPLNAFTSFYYQQENQNVVISKDTDKVINIGNSDVDPKKDEFSGVWEGNFEFSDGDYEFNYFSDKNLKIMVGDKILFDGMSTQNMEQKRITHSIEGIRRLKVFYNMSNSQKLQQIINYYKSLNNADQDDDSNNPIYKSLHDGQGNKTPDLADLKLYINWQLIRRN